MIFFFYPSRLVFRGAESYAYVYIYENFRLVELSWDKPATWYLAAIGVDFCYYWVHRACHGNFFLRIFFINLCKLFNYFTSEIHILWAQHQVHHSSEEFNLAVGLRQSLVQGWCGFVSIGHQSQIGRVRIWWKVVRHVPNMATLTATLALYSLKYFIIWQNDCLNFICLLNSSKIKEQLMFCKLLIKIVFLEKIPNLF